MTPIWSKTVYTTAGGKTLEGEPPEPYGVNIDSNTNGVTFFNSNGKPTNVSSNAGNGESWEFLCNVSGWRWGGGVFSGEIPLNGDLSRAKKEGAKVVFSTSDPTIDIYFDGKITVEANDSTKTYTSFPARVKTGTSGGTVSITAENGTTVDRYCVPENPDANVKPGPIETSSDPKSFVRVSKPVDITARQRVNSAYSDATRAIPATATDDFMLSGYNTSGDAKKLVSDLTTGYTYQSAQAGDNLYIVFPMMFSGEPQLVLSRLVMTGDLNGAGTGQVHPLDPSNTTPYLLLDDDGLTDLDFSVQGDGSKLTVTWVSYQDQQKNSYVVKRRTLDVAANQLNAIQAQKKSASYQYAPVSTSGTVLWAEAANDGSYANAMLKNWLLETNLGLTESMLDNISVTDTRFVNPVFFWATQSKFNQVYGTETVLKTANGRSASVSGTIENMETAEIGGKTYVLYTTSEPAYFDTAAETPVTVGLSDINIHTERGTIYRLYLRALDSSGFGSAKLLQTVIDFQSCTEDTIAESVLKDGVYVNSARAKTQADPYFANLRFVTADVDGTGSQTLALFEMGGNSYLISEADLKVVANGIGGAELTPIFSETTGTEVNIGSDGTNLAAVFTAPMANSQSNAIYIAWWDQNLKSWGAPTILAMRYMQVYEDGIRFALNGEELEKAYLGETTGNESYDKYIASLDVEAKAEIAGGTDKLSFSNLQMAARTVKNADETTSRQLIVLTEGSFSELQKLHFDIGAGKDAYEPYMPTGTSTVGFYAIAFGVGEHALGEGNLGFASYDFSIGNELTGEVSFTNTGTVAIRASESNPAVVELMAGSQKIAEWKLTQPILSGLRVHLTFDSLPLTSSLSAGTSFSLSVLEDAEYIESLGGVAFQGTLDDLLTVEEKPELSFGDFDVSFSDVSGDTAVLNFRASVLNNGSAEADQVFLQFSYGTGETDESGREIYKPIDITGSSFTTERQEQIPRQPVAENYTQGVYRLHSDIDGYKLSKGYYRTVKGSLHVPISCFAEKEDYTGLHLAVEIFSSADDPDLRYGVYSSDHNEYNETNNRRETTVKHWTRFQMPSHIVTALGTTLTMPLSFESTSSNPDIVLTEITDGTEEWSPRMGICYYDPDRKVIVAAPNSTAQAMLNAGQVPTGILQVNDQATNSVYAITYRIGSMSDGVIIFRDDASYRFYNADGSETNLYAAASDNPGWLFMDWATNSGWTGGVTGEIPMNSDLTMANQKGAYFTFDTVASTMKIYFSGELTVSSSFDNYAKTYHFTESPASITFQDANGATNKYGEIHTVKVTADAKGTLIDRYVATYEVNPVSESDPEAPQILWNRSFPDTTSVQNGQSVPMTCYIPDASGLQSVRFNNQTLSETTTPKLVKVDDGLWYFDCSFTKNGTYSVRAFDSSGNTSAGSVKVDWFNDVLNVGAIATAPGLDRTNLSFVDENGSAVNTASGVLATAPFLKSAYSLGTDETSSAYLFESGSFSQGALAKLSGERWLANWNGCYQVRVDRNDGTWARAILPLRNLDTTQPAAKPALEGDGTPSAPYWIGSAADWNTLCSFSSSNDTIGMHFLQTADISVSNMVGTSDHAFAGVYDGGGHTLNFTRSDAPQGCAPFLQAKNAVFRNLHVTGTIQTANKFAAGLCALTDGSITVENCCSSIVVESSLSGDGTHGGFLGVPASGGSVCFTGCVFDGAFHGSSTTHSAGFVGYSRSSLTFKDCLVAPSAFEFTNSQNFFRWADGVACTMENCYYLSNAVNTQGVRSWGIRTGTNVSLDFGSGTSYDVAGLASCTGKEGLLHDGVFYSEAGKTVSFLPSMNNAVSTNLVLVFEATSGTLVSSKGNYQIQMPSQDVTILGKVYPLLSGEGTEASPYLIASTDNWYALADYTNGGYLEAGQHFLQTADISVSRMVGTGTHPFTGVYDGTGHTLNVKLTGTETAVAPFSSIQGATIQDLRVTGTIKGGMHCSGLVGGIKGVDNLILDCLVETDVTTTGTHCGGIVGHGGSSTTRIEGCTFAGSIQGGTHVGVIWGWSDGGTNVSIVNCFEAGKEYSGERVNPIGLGDTSSRTITNTYRTHEQKGSPNRNWVGAGVLGYQVLPGDNTTLDFGAGTGYGAAKLNAFAPGLAWNGTFYAGSGESVQVKPGYSGTELDGGECVVTASAGELTAGTDFWTLVMPAQDVTIDVQGHAWGEPEYKWSDDNSSVTATAICLRDPNHVLKETVATEYILTKPSTYKHEGIGTYRARFKSNVFTEQSVQEVIPIIYCDGGENCPSAHFKDIPKHYWAHMFIDWAVVNRVTAGTGPSTFGPESECTRSQFVTLLWRVMGSPEPTTTENPFKDVRKKDYYYKAVLWAVENGITGGTSETTFGPGVPCTRAQIVMFLWRMEGSEEPTSTENPFKDVKKNAYYAKAVLWAVEKGFTGGTSENTFTPNRVCTRVEAVTFLYRVFAD